MKSYIWKTLPGIISDVPLEDPRYIQTPLTIRSKFVLSFVSVIIPALICNSFLTYSIIFNETREKDLERKAFLGKTLAAQLREHPEAVRDASGFNRFVAECKTAEMEISLLLYDAEAKTLIGDVPFPLPSERLDGLLKAAKGRSIKVGQETSVLGFPVYAEGPVLLLVCPWDIYDKRLANVRWAMVLSALILFASVLVIVFLSSNPVWAWRSASSFVR